jgi:two-component system chemotaxis response regulator CheY
VSDPKTILTVDDSRTIRDMLAVTLTAAGYDVVQAEDGVEALERLRDTRPSAIVTDINMPRMDGFELIEEVRRDSAHKGTPILVLTTESEPERKARAKQAGATGWIVKPFNPEKLLEALRRVGA